MNTRGQYGHSAIGRSTLYNGAARGQYGSTSVGLSLFHTPADEKRASNEINAGFESLVDAMYRAMGVDPAVQRSLDVQMMARDPRGYGKRLAEGLARMKASPYYAIWSSQISPVYEEWRAFRKDPGGGLTDALLSASVGPLFGGDFDIYKRWHSRLDKAYASAASAHVPNLPASPKALEETVPEKLWHGAGELGEGAKEAAKGLFDLTKVAIYGAIGVVGVLVVTLAVQSARGNKPSVDLSSLVRRPR